MWSKKNWFYVFRDVKMKRRAALCLVGILLASILMSGCRGAATEDSENAVTNAQGASSGEGEDETGGALDDGSAEDGFASNGDENGKQDSELSETVTVSAAADGTPKKAVRKQSGDDLEEKVDVNKLPFDVHVTYTLDGREIDAKELAGKSGKLVIRYDYENKTKQIVPVNGKDVETIVPLAFVTGVILSADRFSNIEVENGDVTEVSDNLLVYGYAVPGVREALGIDAAKTQLEDLKDAMQDMDEIADDGKTEKSVAQKDKKKNAAPNTGEKEEGKRSEEKPEPEGDAIEEETFEEQEALEEGEEFEIPEYVEIRADVIDCKIDFTTTIVSNGLFREMEESAIADLREAIDDFGAFGDLGDELVDGGKKLKDGADTFGDGLKQYVDGASGLSSGAKQLASGAKQLADQGASLNSGADQLANGLKALNETLSGTSVAMPSIDMNAVAQRAAENAVTAAYNSLADSGLTEEEKMAVAQAAGAAATQSAANEIGAALQSSGGNGQDPLSELKGAVSTLSEGASQLAQGVSAYTSGAATLSKGANGLRDGAATLSSSGGTLLDGYDKLSEGIGEFEESMEELDEKMMQKIASLSEGALPDFTDRLQAMRTADQGHTAFDVYDGTKGSIRYILETEEIVRK